MNWISVKNRLPDPDVLVVVFWRNQEGNRIDLDYIDREEFSPYTHWLPLPAPPND